MTLRLILMRHAKSAWDNPLLADHDRVLNGRGRRSATAVGNWLRDEGLIPDEVISSTSARTAETFGRLALDVTPSYTRALYHAGPMQMWHVLAGATSQTVLMLGHNPGIAAFAEELVATPPDHHRFWDYPTGATLVASFEAENWSDVQPRSGRATHFVIPRELIDGE